MESGKRPPSPRGIGKQWHDRDIGDDALNKAIIGAIGDYDGYQLPDAKGYSAMTRCGAAPLLFELFLSSQAFECANCAFFDQLEWRMFPDVVMMLVCEAHSFSELPNHCVSYPILPASLHHPSWSVSNSFLRSRDLKNCSEGNCSCKYQLFPKPCICEATSLLKSTLPPSPHQATKETSQTGWVGIPQFPATLNFPNACIGGPPPPVRW